MGTHAPACLWRSEDNVVEPVPSPPSFRGSRNGIQDARYVWQAPLSSEPTLELTFLNLNEKSIVSVRLLCPSHASHLMVPKLFWLKFSSNLD